MTELSPDEEAASARAAEQARLRKARREAKIKAGAENRLNRITGLGGRAPRDDAKPEATTTATATATAATTTPAPATVHHADPEEVDISEHFYQPTTTARIPSPAAAARSASPNISEAQLRQMMLGAATPPPSAMGMGMGGGGMPQPPPGMEDDPMMRMMMQMLGGGNAGGANPFGFPPPGASPSPPGGATPQTTTAPPTRAASIWRILHFLLALTLGLTIALTTPFTGSKSARDRAAGSLAEQLAQDGQAATKTLFWAFATAEVLLLTTRHVVERGKSRLQGAGGSGVLGMVVGFLPAGIKRKVELAMRYGEVAGSVRGDVLVCVFVLGVVGWWRG